MDPFQRAFFAQRFFAHLTLSPLCVLAHVYFAGHFYVLSYHANNVPSGHPWWTAFKVFRSPDATPRAATRWYIGGRSFRRFIAV